MALIKAEQIAAWLQTLPGTPVGAVLLFGESYLCRKSLALVEKALLAGGGELHLIEGEGEDHQSTFNKLATFSLFGGRQVFRITDSELLAASTECSRLWDKVSKAKTAGQEDGIRRALLAFVRGAGLEPEEEALSGLTAAAWRQHFDFDRPGESLDWTRPYLRAMAEQGSQSRSSGDAAGERLAALLAQGLPPQNVLIFLSGSVDKRKKLYRYLKEHATVIDCSVPEGSGAQAQRAQLPILQHIVRDTLKAGGKKMAPELVALLLERVGFHPAAVENELWKLMLSVGDEPLITREALDELVGRSKEEAVYALSDPVGRGDLPEALGVLARLFEDGVFPLIPLAILRNAVRKMLLFRALMAGGEAGLSPQSRYADFQNRLASLRERADLKKLLDGHPYALYTQFTAAAKLPLPRLLAWMRLLLQAELRLKNSAIPPELVLHWLLTAMLPPKTGAQTAGSALPSALAKSTARIKIQPEPASFVRP